MIEVTADLSGIEAFEKFRQEFPKELKQVLKTITRDIRLKVKGETPYAKNSGLAKRSWGQVRVDTGGFSFESEIPNYDYMHILEHGLYPSVGKIPKGDIRPRTVKTGTGIYSRQAIEGWVRKYTDSNKIIDDVADSITDYFEKKFKL